MLESYLTESFAHRHGRAWSYLSSADRKRIPRADYVRNQEELDQLRRQIESLGKTRRKTGEVTVHGSRATATVTISNGLGDDPLRFVLRREQGKWWIDYAASWSPIHPNPSP